MFPLPTPLSSAAKSQWETQLQIFGQLSHTVFDGAEKIIALHLDASKAAIASTANTAQHLLAAHDAREFISYGSSQLQPGIDSVLAYSRQLFGIASSTQAELLATAKARLASAVPAAPSGQVQVEAIVELAAPAFVTEPEPVPVPAPVPVPLPVQAAIVAPVAEPQPAAPAPAPLPLAASLPIAASAPAAIAPPPADVPVVVPVAIKPTAKAAPVASKPAAKGKRK